jgi:hypothetical protein
VSDAAIALGLSRYEERHKWARKITDTVDDK